MIPNIEDVEEVVVGRYYMVNTVTRSHGGKILPIHGSLHEDRQVIGFPDEHWHIDWRFVGERLYREYWFAGGGYLMPWAWPISYQCSDTEVTRRRLMCKRQFGPYMPSERIPWLKKLELKYKNARMKNFICPHKGLPCNATPIENGIIVCRGHGLAFNVETGALVRQTQ